MLCSLSLSSGPERLAAEIHRRPGRTDGQISFRVRHPRQLVGRELERHQAPLLKNLLPVWFQEAETLSVFKRRLKTFLFERTDAGYRLAFSRAAVG